MTSLDAKILFTNVPLHFTNKLILNNIFSQGTKDFSGLNKNQLKTALLNLQKYNVSIQWKYLRTNNLFNVIVMIDNSTLLKSLGNLEQHI